MAGAQVSDVGKKTICFGETSPKAFTSLISVVYLRQLSKAALNKRPIDNRHLLNRLVRPTNEKLAYCHRSVLRLNIVLFNFSSSPCTAVPALY